ncbi:MAG: nucleotide exchange factor GrpE [Desulfobacterota bacterium]|nr:nucleotide exchange factor GrpE [Thermodesulfobacteriota bacterium]
MSRSEKEDKPVTEGKEGSGVAESPSALSASPDQGDGKDLDIEELKRRLEEKEREAKENLDRLLRVAADFENYKKRTVKEREEWTKFANEDLIRAILPFIDNLERAVNHAEKVADAGVLIEGVRLTLKEIHRTLNRFGLTAFDSVGQPFDPERHEAMLMVETDQHEPNRVVEEFQKGYLLNERLLRPATVSVSKPLAKEQ